MFRQMFDFTKLLAISEVGTKYVDEFTFPSGCKCYHSRANTDYQLYMLRTAPEQQAVLTEDIQDEPLKRPRNND